MQEATGAALSPQDPSGADQPADSDPDRPRGVLSPWFARGIIAGLTVVLVAIDQVSKAWAVENLDPMNPPVLLGGLLRLQLVRNSGAAFSLGEGITPVFTLLSATVFVLVTVVLAPRTRNRFWAVAVGLLLAGVAGNLIDRLFRPPGALHGHVIDFLQLPYWAIFNVADMCIVGAAILVGVLSVIFQRSWTGERMQDEEPKK
ncbi:signal peptidase II [Parenemella sanctibonifatiensis]|uniref:Lipoprotein signal peptidase n=1 Tax=Parenemella sanctibonifatiensis TaxID=2016505 RepID=A0A255EK69_9ACTN|nr:signal peptidase II [Parenemella sanctibonifatiensis]OYN89842.1 signal peptidase II [Parenemella sanctibonifatiensis]